MKLPTIHILQLCFDALSPLAVLHKHSNADHGQTKPVRESTARVSSHHTPYLVVVHQFAKQARARQTRERTEVDGGLGVPAPREHATRSRTQGYHMSRARKVLCMYGCRRSKCTGGERAVMGRDARRRACACVRQRQREK